MSATASIASDEQPRKKMRKGTHSCAECRRRKKSCVPHASSPSICTECFTRGTQCRDQQPIQAPKRPLQTSKQDLQQRVTELENALQSIVTKLDTSTTSSTDSSDHQAGKTLKQLRSEVLPPTPESSADSSPEALLENAPVLSLFDNSILSRLEHHGNSHPEDIPPPPLPERENDSSMKINHIRRTLLSLFPPQEIQDVILDASQPWWEAMRDMFPQIYGYEPDISSVNQFVAKWKASGSVQQIAKALLCLSIGLQEAPPSLRHDLGPSFAGIGVRDKIMNAVDDLVISDDDIAGTLDGVECLFMCAKHEMNDGRIRKTWLIFRRALSFCQLLGLHLQPKHSQPSGTLAQRGDSVWKALYQGDRYVSLLLGLPYAVSDSHCTTLDSGEKIASSDTNATHEKYLRRLSTIISHVIDRNQEPPSKNTLPLTIKIEGEMTDLAAEMPREWWSYDIRKEDIGNQMYSRLLPQFWHHQVRTFLHLPFMLKAAADRRYEYNKIAALESAREMINCYRIFRPAQGFGSLVCKVIDFQVFTAGMILVLNLLTISPSSTAREQQEADEDEELITITTDLLDRASHEIDGGVTTQAARALKMFCKARAEPCPPGQKAGKVYIPYFGTVVFVAGKSFANQTYLKGREAMQQPVQLPTPETEIASQFSQDAPGLDNYLAAMPPDPNFGGYHLQQQQGVGFDGNAFANVNLDLDQDWSWFWDNTNVS